MNKHLAKIKIFDPKELRKVAGMHTTVFVDRITNKALDAKGKPLSRIPYSDGYIKNIKNKFKKKDGTGYKGYENVTTEGKIHRKPFYLRGDTARNLKPRGIGSDYYEIGWDGEAAEIVEGNMNRSKHKRDVGSDIPDKEWKWVMSQLGLKIDKEWKKVKNVNITVG